MLNIWKNVHLYYKILYFKCRSTIRKKYDKQEIFSKYSILELNRKLNKTFQRRNRYLFLLKRDPKLHKINVCYLTKVRWYNSEHIEFNHSTIVLKHYYIFYKSYIQTITISEISDLKLVPTVWIVQTYLQFGRSKLFDVRT